MAKDRIGVVGPGRMGLAMVKHLVRTDYPVTVTDISPDAIKAAEALGADSVGNPAGLGKIANFIIIAVGFDNEAIAVMTGENGLLDTMAPGSIIAISSTVHPETVHRLAAAAKAKGIDIYDAPISRGRRAADEGTLLAVVGGADAVVERAAPVYSAFCSDIHHIGPLGHGQIANASGGAFCEREELVRKRRPQPFYKLAVLLTTEEGAGHTGKRRRVAPDLHIGLSQRHAEGLSRGDLGRFLGLDPGQFDLQLTRNRLEFCLRLKVSAFDRHLGVVDFDLFGSHLDRHHLYRPVAIGFEHFRLFGRFRLNEHRLRIRFCGLQPTVGGRLQGVGLDIRRHLVF